LRPTRCRGRTPPLFSIRKREGGNLTQKSKAGRGRFLDLFGFSTEVTGVILSVKMTAGTKNEYFEQGGFQ